MTEFIRTPEDNFDFVEYAKSKENELKKLFGPDVKFRFKATKGVQRKSIGISRLIENQTATQYYKQNYDNSIRRT